MDLLVGLLVLLLVASGAFWLARTLARRAPRWLAVSLTCVALVSVLVFTVWLHGKLWLATLLPLSNAIVLANWIPIGAAFLAGVVAEQSGIPGWRKAAVTTFLGLLACYTVAIDVVAWQPEPQKGRYVEGVCVQTTAASCSACSAVSLLMEYEIPSSEREMMQLCLTRYGGTPELGLYRGLLLKTRQTLWQVQVFHCSADALRQQGSQPALLLVDVVAAVPTRAALPQRAPSHAVVLYGFTDDGRIEIGDPSVGRVRWQLDELLQRWHGEGIRLVPRTARLSVARGAGRQTA